MSYSNNNRHPSCSQSGMSLLELSIVLTVMSIIAGGIIADTVSGQAVQAIEDTAARMRVIEEALSGYVEAYGRVPCPADGDADIGAAAFGVESGAPGACATANFVAGTVVAGVVPTKALGLPDNAMIDGWGRRITYVVDKAATGGIAGSANAVRVNGQSAIEALISHGPNGMGAFPGYAGSTVAGRIRTGGLDADELENASWTSTYVVDFDVDFVQADRTSTFDDIVRYKSVLP